MGKRTITTTLLALVGLALVPSGALAAGLGRLAVQSGLGQPLRAEIEIVNLQRGEAETLSTRIGTPETVLAVGVVPARAFGKAPPMATLSRMK